MAKGISINGFTLKNVKGMNTPDGMAVTADLYFRGRKAGEYFNAGDGGEYSFYPSEGFSQDGIEKALELFPKIKSAVEGLPPISWDIGILVEEMMNRTEVLKSFRKVRKNGKVLILMKSDRYGMYVMSPSDPMLSDEEAIASFRKSIEKSYHHVTDAVYEVIRDEEDLNVNDMEVIL